MSSEDVNINILSRKEALHRDTERYKQAIEEQMDILKQNAGQVSKLAIVVGGALTFSFLLVRLLTRNRRKKNLALAYPPEEYAPSGPRYENQYALTVPRRKEESFLSRNIKKYIATFLITMAQRKLQEVLARNKKDDTDGGFTTDHRE
ncbi:MAG: hypothetical protein H7Z75_22020 [Ferruginibacter sp.]|nr:hypothetical protein [Cytophagales bacterium]